MHSTHDPGSAVRWGAGGALLAAAVLLFSGAVAYFSPHEGTGPEGSVWWLLIASSETTVGVAVLVALLALHALQGARSGRIGAAGTVIAGTGSVLWVVSCVLWLLRVSGGGALDVVFWASILGWVIGFPLVGVGALRARVLPRWAALVLTGYAAGFVLVFLLVEYDLGGARALAALLWLAIAGGFTSAARSRRPAGVDVEVPA